jgi:ABC-type Mn2+/Zn2+ transport system permease subunit
LDLLRLTEHVHGHLGWLAAALLVHPAIVLRDRKRRAHLAVILSSAFVTVASGVGAWIYVAYRDQLRQALFLSSPAVGLLMERKEHLAFASLVFTWAGTAAYFGAPRAKDETQRTTLRTIAFRAFACSAALAIVVAVLGTIVAVHKSF